MLFLHICRMPPKRTSKGKEKVGSASGTARTRESEGGVRRFLSSDTAARYANVVRNWALVPERPVKLEDFPDFELVYLIHNYGWEKVIERPHPVYENLVKEFYANFNTKIDTPGSDHLHQTWVRDWYQIDLTPSIAILWLFICHNIEPISHRTIFTNQKARFIYHLVRGNKIDLATYIYNQI
ncbi:uncharacterized protein LOC111377136 [Olea europaea var. sylvestris]|uniref:uncharacterized protein LOC111377136 n=1 Tax=Olea europaea var. sylvestris TaxID=158386 RepID=UPI000C1D39AB|nr:uncharacterized protein LOC111377136 [Olea europaea var. sylvestris]